MIWFQLTYYALYVGYTTSVCRLGLAHLKWYPKSLLFVGATILPTSYKSENTSTIILYYCYYFCYTTTNNTLQYFIKYFLQWGTYVHVEFPTIY